jgi:hypothetical protein
LRTDGASGTWCALVALRAGEALRAAFALRTGGAVRTLRAGVAFGSGKTLQPAFTLRAGGAGGTLHSGVAFGSSKALETALALRPWRARRSDIPFRSLLAGSTLRTGRALRPLRSIRARTGGERENGRQCKDGWSESHGISSFVASSRVRIFVWSRAHKTRLASPCTIHLATLPMNRGSLYHALDFPDGAFNLPQSFALVGKNGDREYLRGKLLLQRLGEHPASRLAQRAVPVRS